MVKKVYSIGEAAAIIDVAPSTLRHWVKQFAEHLSEQARPAKGTERLLIERDVAIMQRVAELRNQHKSYADIDVELTTISAEEELIPYVDAQVATTAPETPTTALEAPQVTSSGLEVVTAALQAIQAHQTAVDQRMTDLEQRQIQRYQNFVAGILVGALITLLVLGVVWAAVNLR